MRFLGLDAGTTGVKATVFDENGKILGYGFRKYPIVFLEGHRAQQDAGGVWARAKEAIREATAHAGCHLDAISVSVQGDAVIPIGRDYRPLHDCLLGMDYRAEAQARQCGEALGAERLFQITGMRPHPLNSITKIMWLAQHCPELHAQTWKYVTYAVSC